jgi:hypothetical protein
MARYIAVLVAGTVLGSVGAGTAATTGITRFHNGQSFTNGKVDCSAYNNGMACWPDKNNPKHWAAVTRDTGVAITKGETKPKVIYLHLVP